MDFEHILDDLYLQLNECRLHPQQTANKLASLKNSYQGNIFKNQYKTREGLHALESLIQDLSQRPSTGTRLKWSYALHMAADEQASILGQRGIFTTQGTNLHKTLPQRVKDYAIVKGRLSEVYEFGGRTPNQILQELLIDDGLASRKRRNTLMDPIFKYVGIAASYHESHEACTVIILAQDIVSLVAPDVSGKYKRRRGIESGKETAVKLTEQIVLNNVFGNLLPSAINTSNPPAGLGSTGINGGETVVYNNTNTSNNNSLNQPWVGGETVVYNSASNSQVVQQQASANTNINKTMGQTVNYPASSSLSQSQLQEKQYEYYKQQEPTITINSPPNTVVPPTSVPITHPLAVQETSVETKKTEEKSSCTVM